MKRLLRVTPIALLALMLILPAGCGSEIESDGSTYEPAHEEAGLAERAATIALEIESDPDATEEVLKRHGVTAEEFEEMLMEISMDEVLRKEYNTRLGN